MQIGFEQKIIDSELVLSVLIIHENKSTFINRFLYNLPNK
jgi:hypothetical protein